MSIMDGLEFLAWLGGLCRPKIKFEEESEVREYLVQARTRTLGDGWTAWWSCGLPITAAEADEWLKTSSGRNTPWVQHRIVMVPRELNLKG